MEILVLLALFLVLAKPVQLNCTANFERFRPILGPEVSGVSFFLVVLEFPLGTIKLLGHSGRPLKLG